MAHLQLRTFGGLWIDLGSDERQRPVPSPRCLALQAVVAAAGQIGITREKIVGILWAECDEEQARHRLSQTLYMLRRDTGAQWFTGSNQLRLNDPGSSDVTAFQQALDAGQLERAVELYAGPFLDGFYLSGAPEFEVWVDETRARLRFEVLKALDILARRAVDTGDHAQAIKWWRRLRDIEPLHGGWAAGQVRSHIALGELTTALRVAREHEARVRHELETEPDAAIADLILEIQSMASAGPVAAPEPAASPGKPDATLTLPAVEPILHESIAGAGGRSPAKSRAGRAIAIAVILIAASAAAYGGWRMAGSVRTRPPLLAIGTIQPRNLTASGSILRDMLATNLARVSGLQVVANSRLVELLAPGDDAAPMTTVDAARRAGATEIVEGELEVTEAGLNILTLRRVALETGLVVQGYTVRAGDLYALTDSATAAIAGDFGLDPPPDAIAAVRTGSAVAYALYEQGLRAYFHGDHPAAIRLMSAALERDSSFAMAAAYLWRSNWDASRYQEADRLQPIVRRLAARTVPRERLWIEGMLAWAGAPLSDFMRIARELADRYPEDPDGQLLLGRALFAAGEWAGAVQAYDRVVAIDSVSGATSGVLCRVCRALYEMSTVWMWWDSLPAAERSMRRLIAFRPDEETGWTGLVESLLRQGRRTDAEAAVARATRLSADATVFGFYLDRDLIRSGRLDELEARLVSALRTAPPEARGEMPWLLALTLRNQGRLREARDLAAAGIVPGSPVRLDGHVDLVTLAVVALENGDSEEAARRFLDLVAADRSSREQPGFQARNLAWHMTLAGTALAASGDTAAVLALADSVERIGRNSSFGRDPRLHHFLRGLVLQRANRHEEAVAAFRNSLFSLTDGYTRINLELARSLMALGRFDEAIAVLQPTLRGGVDGGNTYVSLTEFHDALARAFEGAGQADSAAFHRRAVERALQHADPTFATSHGTVTPRETSPR